MQSSIVVRRTKPAIGKRPSGGRRWFNAGFAPSNEHSPRFRLCRNSLNVIRLFADKFHIKSRPTLSDKPAKPQRIAIFAVAFVLALMIGATSMVFAQLLDPTVRGVRDIRDILDVTPLTAVPVIERSGRNPHRKMRWAFSRATAGAGS